MLNQNVHTKRALVLDLVLEGRSWSLSVVGYALWVDKFIGKVEKCAEREREHT
jgi:hypothetical protein